MILSIVCFVVGIVLVILGADWLTKGASDLARRLKMSELMIGLTIVAVGTSLPELVISVSSALSGNSGISLGNVLGSNIFNGMLILGVTAMITPIAFSGKMLSREIPFNLLASIVILRIDRDIHEVFARGEGERADFGDARGDLNGGHGRAAKEGAAIHRDHSLARGGVFGDHHAGVDAGANAKHAAGAVPIAHKGEAVAHVGQKGLGLGLLLTFGLALCGRGADRRKDHGRIGLVEGRKTGVGMLGQASATRIHAFVRQILRVGEAEKGNGQRERHGKGDGENDHQRVCQGFHQ